MGIGIQTLYAAKTELISLITWWDPQPKGWYMTP